jgi:hypothetical protein
VGRGIFLKENFTLNLLTITRFDIFFFDIFSQTLKRLNMDS